MLSGHAATFVDEDERKVRWKDFTFACLHLKSRHQALQGVGRKRHLAKVTSPNEASCEHMHEQRNEAGRTSQRVVAADAEHVNASILFKQCGKDGVEVCGTAVVELRAQGKDGPHRAGAH